MEREMGEQTSSNAPKCHDRLLLCQSDITGRLEMIKKILKETGCPEENDWLGKNADLIRFKEKLEKRLVDINSKIYTTTVSEERL